uniref:DUF4708 domain-containing protein n=1 Tax=Panagrellus redivivus TaxID=6233 RepID=A0A7E4ZQ75_PANRE
MPQDTEPHHLVKCIIKHYRVADVLRDPRGPLPAGYRLDELVFLVCYVNGSDGKPVKDDAYMPYDAVAGSRHFKQYAEHFLTPCVGRVIGIHSQTNKEVISFADSETVRHKHEEYMGKLNQQLKRKSHPQSQVEANPDQHTAKKLRHSDGAPSIKSKFVIAEWNERLALAGQKGNANLPEAASAHFKTLGNSSSKSYLTTKSVSTDRKTPEPQKRDAEHNSPKAVISMEVFPYAIRKDNRFSPSPSHSESGESINSSASFESAPLDFIDSFGADEPTEKWNWRCCLM